MSEVDSLKEVSEKLNKFLGPEFISKRIGEGGRHFSYVEGHQLISIANEIFGFNGWSNCVVHRTVDFAEQVDGRWNISVSVVSRVVLSQKYGEVYHEDVGCGSAERMISKSKAFEKAFKEGATDAVKRCLRYFGESLGNCVYSKPYLDLIGGVRDKGKLIDFDEEGLYRLPINQVGKRRCNGVRVEDGVDSGKRQCFGRSKGRVAPVFVDGPLVVTRDGSLKDDVDEYVMDDDVWPESLI